MKKDRRITCRKFPRWTRVCPSMHREGMHASFHPHCGEWVTVRDHVANMARDDKDCESLDFGRKALPMKRDADYDRARRKMRRLCSRGASEQLDAAAATAAALSLNTRNAIDAVRMLALHEQRALLCPCAVLPRLLRGSDVDGSILCPLCEETGIVWPLAIRSRAPWGERRW